LRNRAKLFVDNILTYGSVTILARIIPVVMLPIIARILPDTSNFGVYDLYGVITFFGGLLAQLGLLSAIYKFFFDRDDIQSKYNVTTTSFLIILVSSLINCIGLIFIYYFFRDIFFHGVQFNVILLSSLGIFVANMSAIVLHPSRMLNERKVFVVISLGGAVFQKALSVILILVGFAYFGMIYAAIATSALTLLYVGYRNKDFFLRGHFELNTAKSLLKFGLPLLPAQLIYWVYGNIDRVMILKYSTLAELGVYGIGSRVASITNLISAAFTIGWAHFSFTAMKDDDYKGVISTVFSMCFAACTVIYLIFYLFKDIVFSILFVDNYARGVEVYPMLLINPLLIIFMYIMENPLYKIKKTIYFPIIHSVGCIVNIVLNFLLIPEPGLFGISGIFGAAVATTAGFLTSLTVFIIVIVYKKKLLEINKKLLGMICLFLLLFVCVNIPGVNTWYTLLPISAYIALVALSYKDQAMRYYKRWQEG